MENNLYVLDANVILEYVYGRKHGLIAKQILTDAIEGTIRLVTPSCTLDEITEVLCGNLDDLEEVRQHLQYLEKLSRQEVLHIVVPNTDVRMKAIDIARTGHSKSGYPELSDSLYHALAIANKATFVTNDERHYSKTKVFGHIIKLVDY
ncbi:MAG: type II toxin-antitoxin system VapC family toxin [Proteobacteria bacterium]|nr:type II toxin-antitoxin system VapC family toxin [Pseudomonadota bacterium]